MKYRPTPLNIASVIVIGFSIYNALYPGLEGWGFLFLINFLPFGLLGLLGDYFLQRFLKKYRWTFIIESFFLTIIFLCYSYTQRTKTLIIPDHLESKYIIAIYGVDNAPKLPSSPLCWSYEIMIPANGIFMTSSDIESDLPKTKMRTFSGVELNSEDSKLGWTSFSDDKFECNGKSYYFKSWMVDSSCCMYSNMEIDSFKVNFQRQFCK